MSDGNRERPCTVGDLVELLLRLPPETRVMVSGYEGGYDDANSNPEITKIALNVNGPWYYGPHDSADNSVVTNHKIVDAIIL
jgi:hypothetical protein